MASFGKQFAFMRRIGATLWLTRDCFKLTFSEMDCGHFINVAKMMMRKSHKADAEAAACACYSGGEDAEAAADLAMDQAFREAARAKNDALLTMQYVRVREEHGFILTGPK